MTFRFSSGRCRSTSSEDRGCWQSNRFWVPHSIADWLGMINAGFLALFTYQTVQLELSRRNGAHWSAKRVKLLKHVYSIPRFTWLFKPKVPNQTGELRFGSQETRIRSHSTFGTQPKNNRTHWHGVLYHSPLRPLFVLPSVVWSLSLVFCIAIQMGISCLGKDHLSVSSESRGN